MNRSCPRGQWSQFPDRPRRPLAFFGFASDILFLFIEQPRWPLGLVWTLRVIFAAQRFFNARAIFVALLFLQIAPDAST